MNHSLSHCCQVEAPVEAVIEGTQIAISILIEFQGMEGASEAGFQVAQYRLIQRNTGSSLGWRPFTTTA